MKSYNKLFNEPSEKSTKWQGDFLYLFENTNYMVVNEYLDDTNVEAVYMEDFFIQRIIKLYTLKDSKEELKELTSFVEYYYRDEIPSIIIGEKELVIDTVEGKVVVKKLTDEMPEAKEISKQLNIDLETTQRTGCCFDGSFILSKNFNFKNDLVTGYYYGASDKAKFLHSWIEVKDLVIDFTMNSIMKKEDYYRIRHIDKSDIMQRISSEDIKKDIEEYGDVLSEICPTIDIYNAYRDEIIRELENKKVRGEI